MEKLAALGGKKAVSLGIKKWPDDFVKAHKEELQAALNRVLERGVIAGPFAPEVVALQEEFARYMGVKNALALNSGTSAIHTAVAAAGIGPGDEVITSAHTFVASAVAVLHNNAIPIFVDIDPKTYNMDPAKIEEKITKKTKAIEPVHIYGLPADMDPIKKIADSYGLTVIEDVAQAHGAQYKGKKAGGLGDMGCFSIQATKHMTSGEGGMLVTDDDDLLQAAERIRVFGEDIRPWKPREYKSYVMGWMYRMTELQASFARVFLKHLDENIETRVKNSEYLTSHLKKIPGLIPPYVPPDRTHTYYIYRIRVDPSQLDIKMPTNEFRDRLVAALRAEGVPADIYSYHAVYMSPLFQRLEGYGKGCPWSCKYVERKIEYHEGDCPVAETVGKETFNFWDIAAPNDLELMEQYVYALKKVIENADQLKNIKLEKYTLTGGHILVPETA